MSDRDWYEDYNEDVLKPQLRKAFPNDPKILAERIEALEVGSARQTEDIKNLYANETRDLDQMLNIESVLKKLTLRTYNMCVALMTGLPLEKLTIKKDLWELYEDLSGEKEVVQKGIGDDSSVDEPEPIRLSSNGMSIGWKNEGMPSTHSKPDSDCINIRENVKFLTNDTYIVISRELHDEIKEFLYQHANVLYNKVAHQLYFRLKKEVERH